MRRFSGFEFRHSSFEFIYMSYMAYMVVKAAFPSVFRLQPIFLPWRAWRTWR